MFGRTIEMVFIDVEQRAMRVICKTYDMYNAECKVLFTYPPQGLEGRRFKLTLTAVLHDHVIVKFPRPDMHVLGIVDYLLNPINELWIVSGWLNIEGEHAEFVPGIPGVVFWIVLNARDMLQKYSAYLDDERLRKLIEDASLGSVYWRNMFMRCCDELEKMRRFAERTKDEVLKFMVEQAKRNIELRRNIEDALGIELDPYLYIVYRQKLRKREAETREKRLIEAVATGEERQESEEEEAP